METKKTTTKKSVTKSTTSTKSVEPLSKQDERIINDYSNGVDMNIICARYMVHRTYVEKLITK